VACREYTKFVYCYGAHCVPAIAQGIEAAPGFMVSVAGVRRDYPDWPARSSDWMIFCAQIAMVLSTCENRQCAKELSYFGAIAFTFEQPGKYAKAGSLRSIEVEIREMPQCNLKDGDGPYQVRPTRHGKCNYAGWFNSTIASFTPASATGINGLSEEHAAELVEAFLSLCWIGQHSGHLRPTIGDMERFCGYVKSSLLSWTAHSAACLSASIPKATPAPVEAWPPQNSWADAAPAAAPAAAASWQANPAPQWGLRRWQGAFRQPSPATSSISPKRQQKA
jgi:hypothetical protein